MTERIEMQFAVGRGFNKRHSDVDGCAEVSLEEIHSACRVLGLKLHSISDPERVEGKDSTYQWYVTASLSDERVHALFGEGRFDMRDVDYGREK